MAVGLEVNLSIIERHTYPPPHPHFFIYIFAFMTFNFIMFATLVIFAPCNSDSLFILNKNIQGG